MFNQLFNQSDVCEQRNLPIRFPSRSLCFLNVINAAYLCSPSSVLRASSGLRSLLILTSIIASERIERCRNVQLAGGCSRFVARLVQLSQPTALSNHRATSTSQSKGTGIEMSRLAVALLLVCVHTGSVYGKKMRPSGGMVECDFVGELTRIRVCIHGVVFASIHAFRHLSGHIWGIMINDTPRMIKEIRSCATLRFFTSIDVRIALLFLSGFSNIGSTIYLPSSLLSWN